MSTVSSVQSKGSQRGKGNEGQQHGAPSGLLVSQTSSELFSAALRDAARLTLRDEEEKLSSSLAELVALPPVKVCEELLGFSIHSPALENLFFVGTNGSKLGISLSGFSSAWHLPPHRDAYYDPTLWNAVQSKSGGGGPRFTYERFTRALSLSLSECTGSTAPIRLYVYAGFLPRPVADAIKTALLAKAAPAGELLDADSDVMAWRRIQRLHLEADDPTSAEDIKELYHRYVTACQSVLDKAEATLREVQELEIPNLRHPLCLLKQWSSLPQAIERGDSMSFWYIVGLDY
ncbi:hypothetical protein FOZ61_004717 [Perkinsus olseni]|uniref:Uncharacterized protein n=1 Tax=Perkinsus olseni TaxID=32597 RepID=A0A7J6LJK0_PEROL|nr:hypothetical protein FOZ61_004717 [Perkinsus olseni]KAF4672536.1 hypothetical protein FOL46_008828 [Perkinsus olseni]